ncbi:hypothetical protein ZWY2020_027817 [Hordeum vulgare]|nr:hypothetical protein ZWY2020_027817 [Hordeum vulgare]
MSFEEPTSQPPGHQSTLAAGQAAPPDPAYLRPKSAAIVITCSSATACDSAEARPTIRPRVPHRFCQVRAKHPHRVLRARAATFRPPHDLGISRPRRDGGGAPARASSSQAKARETPPPSPAASASATAAPPAEDAPLLPGEGVVRRRAVRERFAARSLSFRRDVGHAASETFLLTRLTLSLLRYLVHPPPLPFPLVIRAVLLPPLPLGDLLLLLVRFDSYRWIRQFLALCCYALLLMPGFIQVLYYYFFSSQVHRSVVYGEQPRNRLDLYIPAGTTGLKPVVAFVTGGAWIIGYKGWGALLGRRLAERGILVACIDYRNFPQGTIGDMVEDVSRGISFVCNNIASYGGDPERIYLVGQSAGAHIAACALINQAIRECGEDTSTWSVAQLKAYFGISGGYNLLNLVDHFHRRGLYRSVFLSIMEGEESLRKFSPEVVVKDVAVRSAVSLLPQIILFHGTSDCSMPSAESEAFLAALQQRGAKADLFLYEGKTHTDLFLQDPLRGGRDKMLKRLSP